MADWVHVADEADIKKILAVDMNGKEIVLFRLPDGVYALDNVCSHEYSRLSEGEVWDGRIYCAKHGSSFDIKTGTVSGLPATRPVERLDVKVENGGIYVYLEDWY